MSPEVKDLIDNYNKEIDHQAEILNKANSECPYFRFTDNIYSELTKKDKALLQDIAEEYERNETDVMELWFQLLQKRKQELEPNREKEQFQKYKEMIDKLPKNIFQKITKKNRRRYFLYTEEQLLRYAYKTMGIYINKALLTFYKSKDLFHPLTTLNNNPYYHRDQVIVLDFLERQKDISLFILRPRFVKSKLTLPQGNWLDFIDNDDTRSEAEILNTNSKLYLEITNFIYSLLDIAREQLTDKATIKDIRLLRNEIISTGAPYNHAVNILKRYGFTMTKIRNFGVKTYIGELNSKMIEHNPYYSKILRFPSIQGSNTKEKYSVGFMYKRVDNIKLSQFYLNKISELSVFQAILNKTTPPKKINLEETELLRHLNTRECRACKDRFQLKKDKRGPEPIYCPICKETGEDVRYRMRQNYKKKKNKM